jgi:hypothetical protein
MRHFTPETITHQVAAWLRKQARLGFYYSSEDLDSWQYLHDCTCRAPSDPNKEHLGVILSLTRDCSMGFSSTLLMGWHMSICSVYQDQPRQYDHKEGVMWCEHVFESFEPEVRQQVMPNRGKFNVMPGWRHFILSVDNWENEEDPHVALDPSRR